MPSVVLLAAASTVLGSGAGASLVLLAIEVRGCTADGERKRRRACALSTPRGAGPAITSR